MRVVVNIARSFVCEFDAGAISSRCDGASALGALFHAKGRAKPCSEGFRHAKPQLSTTLHDDRKNSLGGYSDAEGKPPAGRTSNSRPLGQRVCLSEPLQGAVL